MDPNSILSGSNTSNCFTFTEIPISTFLTIIIALFVAWIGFLQWKLSRAKFKLDLFDRRHEIYIKVKTFIANFMGSSSSFSSNENQNQFLRDIKDVKFFYGQEIADLLTDVYHLVSEYHVVELMSNSTTELPEKKEECIEKMDKIRNTIQNRGNDFDKKVNKYLNFEKWK